MKRLKIFIVFLFGALTPNIAAGVTPESAAVQPAEAAVSASVQPAEAAAAAYQSANYTAAASLYQRILDSCYLDRKSEARVYYNLGNSYFKAGELAQAILAYERSLRINPTSRDTRYNLSFARAQIVDNIEDNRAFFLIDWLQFIRNLLTESTWLWISLIAFILLVASVLVFLLIANCKKIAFSLALIALIIWLTGLLNALSLHQRDALRNEAIITNGVVVAKASPDRAGTELFTLHEGTKVTIHETLGTPPNQWVNIHVANYVGWIPASTLTRI